MAGTSSPSPDQEPVRSETPPATVEPPATRKPAAEKKAPPIEAKPLGTFIQEDFFPALTQALAAINITNISLLWVPELNQVRGAWAEGKHEFIITFTQGDLKGLKTFAYSSYGAPPSTLESFMIDERKVTLELLVFYTIQRLTAQKVW